MHNNNYIIIIFYIHWYKPFITSFYYYNLNYRTLNIFEWLHNFQPNRELYQILSSNKVQYLHVTVIKNKHYHYYYYYENNNTKFFLI